MERTEKWDRRFLDLAAMIASWSKDPSTQCGAVIVRPDRSVASVGFNGFPRGVPDLEEHLNNREEKYARVVHAEVNAILACKESMVGFTLYSVPPAIGPSCERCATCIIQVGITRIVYLHNDNAEHVKRWGSSIARGLEMFTSAGVVVTPYKPMVRELPPGEVMPLAPLMRDDDIE